MRNRFWVLLAVAVVLGFATADAHAGPRGRRGGGPRAGAARSGQARGGNAGTARPQRRRLDRQLQSASPRNFSGNLAGGNLQNKVSQLTTNFTPANQPFTPAWYAAHPRAWQYTHPHADAWAVATFGAAAAWLGIAATTGDGGTVYTGESAEAYDEQLVDQNEPQDEQNGEFLPLGVFALAPKTQHEASAVVQLAVDKQGTLRGNYYDVLTGADQPVAGTLDKQTQLATFAVPSGNVRFETTLASLTRASGSVRLRFRNGNTRQWTLARFDNPAPTTPSPQRSGMPLAR